MEDVRFHATPEPSSDALTALVAVAPTVPSFTFAFVRAQRRLGHEPWLLSLESREGLIAGCTAFLSRRFLRNSLQIASLPFIPKEHQATFWDGLLDHCRRQKIWKLRVGTFASASADIPQLPGEVNRVARQEHVLDLNGRDFIKGLSSNHAKNVKRAQKAEVEVHRQRNAEACEAHVKLIVASMDRRSERGEAVPDAAGLEKYLAFVEEGAGELFQAELQGEVVSSVLVLMASKGAYYQSAGTSPKGMDCGASHFLVCEIARHLQKQSFTEFGLGGTRESEQGLRRFKTGFGARSIPLEAAEFLIGGQFRRRWSKRAAEFRQNPIAFLHQAIVRVERYVVYSADPRNVPAPDEREGWTFRKLSDADLEELADQYDEARSDLKRMKREGFNGAYGVFCDGELANITWLITAEQDRLRPIRNIKLRKGEVELTHGFTRKKFRGQGLFPFVLRHLFRVAADQGAEAVFGMHYITNVASQRGIEKSGYVRRGTVIRCAFRRLLKGRSITFRGHRWRSPPGSGQHS